MISMLTSIEIAELARAFEGNSARSAMEIIPVFDEQGKLLGSVPRLLCHRLGLIHKVAYCFIIDENWKLLLQTRGGGKNGADRVDVAVGGHITVDDVNIVDAVVREAFEELGAQLDRNKLEHVSTYFRETPPKPEKPREINREIREVFAYHVAREDRDGLHSLFAGRLEKAEVKAVDWYGIGELIALCEQGRAADGLAGSLTHLLAWKERSVS